MVQIKLKGVIGVESPSPRSFWCGIHQPDFPGKNLGIMEHFSFGWCKEKSRGTSAAKISKSDIDSVPEKAFSSTFYYFLVVLRVEFLLKTESVYLRDAEVT